LLLESQLQALYFDATLATMVEVQENLAVAFLFIFGKGRISSGKNQNPCLNFLKREYKFKTSNPIP
jgi:hypothetical protein